MNDARNERRRSLLERIGERRFTEHPRTNADRVEEVNVLMDALFVMTGVDHLPDEDGPETALSDLLAHLLHYADARDVDFIDCLQRAHVHYNAEIEEDAG